MRGFSHFAGRGFKSIPKNVVKLPEAGKLSIKGNVDDWQLGLRDKQFGGAEAFRLTQAKR